MVGGARHPGQVAAHADMQECLAKYDLTGVQLRELFLSLCPGDLSTETKNFVQLLIEYDRLTLLPEIFGQFETLKNEREACRRLDHHRFWFWRARARGLVADLKNASNARSIRR
jgi:F-type H+-transporting ATPase subunit delta